jgi:SNF2 family DNA or RNA helicase
MAESVVSSLFPSDLSDMLFFIRRLNPQNIGSGEYDNHCVDCVPLAMQAKMQAEDRPASAKIRMILKLLREIDDRSDGEEKTIIFSQFTSMLDLIEPFLREEGIRYVRCALPNKPFFGLVDSCGL